MPRGGDNSRGCSHGRGRGRGRGRGQTTEPMSEYQGMHGEKRPHTSSHSSDSESIPEVKKPWAGKENSEKYVKEQHRKYKLSRQLMESGAGLLRIAIRRLHDSRELCSPLYGIYFKEKEQELMDKAFASLCDILDGAQLEETFLQPDAGTQTESAVTCSTSTQTRESSSTTTSVQTVPTTTLTTATTSVQTALRLDDNPQPRTYAEALTQTEGRQLPQPSKPKGAATTRANRTISHQAAPKPQRKNDTFTTRAYVVHGIRSTDKLWKVREEIEKDNKRFLGRLQGIRWLLQAERRRGKGASSVVIYLDCPKIRPPYAWLGHRKLRVDVYEFDRGRDVEMS